MVEYLNNKIVEYDWYFGAFLFYQNIIKKWDFRLLWFLLQKLQFRRNSPHSNDKIFELWMVMFQAIHLLFLSK